jgi:phosphoribosyl-ATP pyrophosphohydrolase/phosphoribosyl-AMP cyclohydrolase
VSDTLPDVTDPATLVYDERGLITAVVQDEASKDVLMVAWMNQEAVRRTLDSGRTWFFSRSRGELWRKGDTSGNVQHVREVRYDCDGDTLLVLVHQEGPACHTGERSCFYRTLPTT